MSCCSANDLGSLSRICKMLMDEPDILDVAFIFVEPRSILMPLRAFIDDFLISGENFGAEGQLIDKFGSIVLFVQIVLSRFDVS